MQYQQPNSRRRTVHHDKPSFASVDNAVRKSGIRSRPRVQYSSEMDEIEMARNALGPRNVSVTVARDGFSDIHSIANVQKLSMLQEVYPEFAIEVLEDVLIAAQFRIDFAASMLGELSRELVKKSSVPERVDLDWTTVQYDMETDDHWHEVSESRPEMQQWVMVQDDWEVVDNDLVSPPKTRSYADVLANGNCASNAVLASPPLPRIAVSTSLAPLVRQTNVTHEIDDLASDELSIKSFGARKRRASRKFRRH